MTHESGDARPAGSRPGLITTRQVLDAAGVARAVEAIAAELRRRRGDDAAELALVGIHSGGVPLAKRLAQALAATGWPAPPVGMIDITLYRDDVFLGLPQPIVGETELGFDVNGRRLVLVDDVLFTGRTVRSALDALIDFGRPRSIELAVLVDRGHRELPIEPTYVGCRAETRLDENVHVALTELGAASDAVVVESRRGTA